MGSRIPPKSGIVFFPAEFHPDNLIAQGTAFPSSTYTESGPGPGLPINGEAGSRWKPRVTGPQTRGLGVRTIHGGYAGPEGARVVYELDTDTDLESLRGWNEPCLPTSWSAPASGWLNANSFDAVAAAALPSGVIVAIGADSSTESVGSTWGYNPRTETWDDRYDWSTGPGLPMPLAMVYDPIGERLIAWSGHGDAGDQDTRAYQSTDGGSTWTFYTRGMYPVQVNASRRVRVAVDPRGGDWLACIHDSLCASSDNGVTWELVDTMVDGEKYTPIRTRTGWLVAYLSTEVSTLHQIMVRRLGTARSLFTSAAEEVVSTIETGDLEGCADADDVIYLLTTGTTGIERAISTVFRSVDSGATWLPYTWRFDLGDSTTSLLTSLENVVPSGGQLHCVYYSGSAATAEVDGTVAALTLGGWSQLEHGSGDLAVNQQNRASYGFLGVAGFGESRGALWLPINTPDNAGWGRASLGPGTLDFTPTAGQGMQLICTAGQQEMFEITLPVDVDFDMGEASFLVNTGSASLATIGSGPTPGAFLRPRLGNATDTYGPYIDIASNGLQVRDGASVLASVTILTASMTAHVCHVRWQISGDKISVWYRQAGVDPVEVWHLLADGESLTDLGVPPTEHAGLTWGNNTGAVGNVTWGMVGFSAGGDWLTSIDPQTKAGLGSAAGVRGLRWGKAVSASAAGSYPIPELTETDEEIGYLSATGGPTHPGEGVVLPVAYEHGVHHIHPNVSPSPRDYFEPDVDAIQYIAYDFRFETWAYGAIALLAQQCRARTIVVQADDGAGAWETGSTLDFATVTNALYTLLGDTLVPRAGTPTNDRYHPEGELARPPYEGGIGGWVRMSTGGGAAFVYREIVKQGPGFWTSDTTMQQIRLVVEGLDGTEDALGTGTIYNHSGILLIHRTTLRIRRYVRIVIDTLGTSDGVKVRIGLAGVGRLVSLGADPDFGWTQRLQLERVVSRSGDGTPSIAARGPSRRIWSYSYQEGGAMMQDMRLLTESPDYVGGSGGGQPIGTEDDIWTLWDYVDVGMISGERPCVIVGKLPAGSATLKDRTRYIYGAWMAESLIITGESGTEGLDEHTRGDGPTVEEIR